MLDDELAILDPLELGLTRQPAHFERMTA